MPRNLTYLAVPYSTPDRKKLLERVETVNKLALRLIKKGEIVYSPITHTHILSEIKEDGGLPKTWEFWERQDIAFLECSKHLAVLCLPGWLESRGVRAEILYAQENKIPRSFYRYDTANNLFIKDTVNLESCFINYTNN